MKTLRDLIDAIRELAAAIRDLKKPNVTPSGGGGGGPIEPR